MVVCLIPGHEKVQHGLGLGILTVSSLAFLRDFLFWLTRFFRRVDVLGGENVFPGLNSVLFAGVRALIDLRPLLDSFLGNFDFSHWFFLFLFDFCWGFPLVFPLKF